MNKIFFIIIFFLISFNSFAEANTDQWKESKKSYKDLINEGYEIKSYDTSNIKLDGGITILFFVTVLQKNKEVFECQEYQTVDSKMETLDLSLICKELVQPYKAGLGI